MTGPADPSRDLIFGMLALQAGLIRSDQLVAAFGAWSSNKAVTMTEILVRLGALDTAEAEGLAGRVSEHIGRNDTDPGQPPVNATTEDAKPYPRSANAANP